MAQVQQVFARWCGRAALPSTGWCRGAPGCPGLSLLRATGCAPGRCHNAPGQWEDRGGRNRVRNSQHPQSESKLSLLLCSVGLAGFHSCGRKALSQTFCIDSLHSSTCDVVMLSKRLAFQTLPLGRKVNFQAYLKHACIFFCPLE